MRQNFTIIAPGSLTAPRDEGGEMLHRETGGEGIRDRSAHTGDIVYSYPEMLMG